MKRRARLYAFLCLVAPVAFWSLRGSFSAPSAARVSPDPAVVVSAPERVEAGAENEDSTELPADHLAQKAAQRARRLAAAQADRSPADARFRLPDESGGLREFVVALDEVFIPAEGALRALPPAAGLAEHLARLAPPEFEAAEDWRRSAAPRLVLYPRSAPRTHWTRRIVTPGLAVTLPSATAPAPAPRPELGVLAWERPGYAPTQAIARVVGDAAQPLRACEVFGAESGTGVRPLLARAHRPAAVPSAPLFPKQWHLRNTGQGGATPGIDIRATRAWDFAQGSGVVIGVVDGAMDRYHAAFYGSIQHTLAQDWIDGDDQPWASDAESDQNHATAVAGLALARGFATPGSGDSASPARVCGVAPFAGLASLRLIGGYTSEEDDAEAMVWEPAKIAVKNNSWAPYPFPDTLYPLPPLMREALESAVSEGRGGRGTIFVWSAGNGRKENFQGPKNAYAANRQAIAVSAVDQDGAPAYFSDGGPHVLVCAPGLGKGKGAVALTTADRVGLKGYNGKYVTGADYRDQDYTNSFRGTSASAPLVSGVVALLLELRPDLGWRDVKEILMRSATELRAADKAWTRRAGSSTGPGGRIKHHPRFGAGLLNAERALRLAQDWTLLPDAQRVTGTLPGFSSGWRSLQDGAREFSEYSFQLDSAVALRIEDVELTLDLRHPYRGDLTIQLVSPDGVVSEFVQRTYLDDQADYSGYTFSSVRHWGESSRGSGAAPGAWRLRIRDDVPGDRGSLRSATLRLHGVPSSAPEITRDLADLNTSTGDSLLVHFDVKGTDLEFTWFRNGKRVRKTAGPVYFVAKPTRAELEATYSCAVSNPLGTVVSKTVRATGARPEIVLQVPVGEAINYLPENPFAVPARWSLESPYGVQIDPATGRLSTSGGVYTSGSGVVVVRSGDRVLRIPFSYWPVYGSS